MDKIIEAFSHDINYRKKLGLPNDVREEYAALAQGEYNVNYLFTHPIDGRKLVMRINVGSQMHLERQIEYEAHALKLIEKSGRTPKVLYVDGSKSVSEFGMLVMNYLSGHSPDYKNKAEMNAVMSCMADIHAVPIDENEVIWGEPDSVPRDSTKLIAPADPAVAILDECEAMLKTYLDSLLGNLETKKRLRSLLDRAHEIASMPVESEGAYRCCINTELNSTNFLISGPLDKPTASLVDWEKPLYADPAQDLGHLLAPTTTFWKTDDILSSEEVDRLIEEYVRMVSGRFDTSGIRERTLRLANITCLRGLTWCAMAWVQYKEPDKMIANESTRKKLDEYLSDAFLKDIERRLYV